MTRTNQCLGKQAEFIVQLMMFDEDYRQGGINFNMAKLALINNKDGWMKVGHIRDDKDFDALVRRTLSNLNRSNALKRAGRNENYYKGPAYDERLNSVVIDICQALEVDVDFGGISSKEESGKRRVMENIKNGTIPFSFLCSDMTKNLYFFTEGQKLKLAQLSVEFGWSDPALHVI